MREKFQKRKRNAFSSNILFTILFCSFSIADNHNGNGIITLIDFKYCIPGRLTITEFVLLSLVMLEDSGMLDTYVGELLNKTKKRDDTSAVDELEPRGKFCDMIR